MEDRTGTAYDSERLGEPGQSGVPTGEQRPTNEEGGMRDSISSDVHVPGPYPSDSTDTSASSSGPEPTKETRDANSLGDLTGDDGTSKMREETGGLGSPLYDDEKRADK
jgi:hypothetical protein